MALTQKGELWVLEQVIQRSDYNFIKVRLVKEKPKLSVSGTSRFFCLQIFRIKLKSLARLEITLGGMVLFYVCINCNETGEFDAPV